MDCQNPRCDGWVAVDDHRTNRCTTHVPEPWNPVRIVKNYPRSKKFYVVRYLKEVP